MSSSPLPFLLCFLPFTTHHRQSHFFLHSLYCPRLCHFPPLPFIIFYFFSSSILLPSPHHSPDKKWVHDLVPDQEREREGERGSVLSSCLSFSAIQVKMCRSNSSPHSIPSSSFLHTPPSTSHFSFGSLVCILPSISQIYSSLLLYISFTSLSPSENTQKVMEEAQDHKVFVTKEKDLLHLMTFPIFSSLLCRRTGMGEKFSQILK